MIFFLGMLSMLSLELFLYVLYAYIETRKINKENEAYGVRWEKELKQAVFDGRMGYNEVSGGYYDLPKSQWPEEMQ